MMKTLSICLLISINCFAQYGKPQLVARYSGIDSFNAPDGLYCFTSDPNPTNEGVFSRCLNREGQALMVKWNPNFELLATSESKLFSQPIEVLGKTSWYEFGEVGVNNLYEYKDNKLTVINLKNLGPVFASVDSFTAIKDGFYIYRLSDETKKLQSWKNHNVGTLVTEGMAHIFPPVSSVEGNFIVKTRRDNLNENSPDELIFWDGNFQTILKDQDADPESKILSFRHQHALDKNAVALVIKDSEGEALVILKDGKMMEVARAGKELIEFDYFSPKMRNGVLVFRGLDLNKQKAVWLFSDNKLIKLVTQGDVVKTDKGLARIDYQSQDSIFYSSPGIGPRGEIYLQATLTDIDSPMTLLGIGLIKFLKE